MKVRILWVPPAERVLKPGEVFNLPEDLAARLLAAEEAESVSDDTPAIELPAPEPAAEPEAAEPEPAPEPDPAPPAKSKK
jgi:hypothetical protein